MLGYVSHMGMLHMAMLGYVSHMGIKVEEPHSLQWAPQRLLWLPCRLLLHMPPYP
jgi:hypothetical protein